MARWFAGGLLVLAIAGFGAFQYGRSLLGPVSDDAAAILFGIETGTSFTAVAKRLEANGLIRSARAATWLARAQGLDQKLHAGEYELSARQSTEEILETITNGRVKTWPVTLPEGSRAVDIAARLEAAGLARSEEFIAAASDPVLASELGVPAAGLEGYLYPDTYRLPRGLSARQIARVMVKQFDRVWDEEVSDLADSSPLSKNEIVILASIVEKETAAPAERPLIASVFLNRLEKGMRLETDPTVIYGIPKFDGNLRRKHLEDGNNPYNTYRIPGLPPGAIANPGSDALRAVVEPESADFFYFVSRNDGTHHFSVTYREHVNAVNRYQKRRRR